MKDNTRTAIGYVCFAAVCIVYLAGLFAVPILLSIPTEHTINFNLTSDNNSVELLKTIERMQNEQVLCNQTINLTQEEINNSAHK